MVNHRQRRRHVYTGTIEIKFFFDIEDHKRMADNRTKIALKAIYNPLLPDDVLSKALAAY